MNPKLQKTIREIERTKERIAQLQAALPELEKQKTELENAEIIKVFRSVDVAPADFTAFIEAYRAGKVPATPKPAAAFSPQTNRMEDTEYEED